MTNPRTKGYEAEIWVFGHSGLSAENLIQFFSVVLVDTVYKKVNFCPLALTFIILFLRNTDLCMYIFAYFYVCCSEVVKVKFDTCCRQIRHLPVERQMFLKCLW